MTPMDSTIEDYRAKVGVAFFGGCGSNVLRLTIDGYHPKDYPDFFLFGANTDAKVAQHHFGNSDNPNLKRWIDAQALIIHQLGGNTVTKGRGAGGKPSVGREAAETDESMREMEKFFSSVDELVFVGAVGGGTGTGALPVAAKLAQKLKKSTIAIVVLPEPNEGRTGKAMAALNEIRELVPTIPIRNSYLKELMANMSEEERSKLTFQDAWDLVNQNSVVPMLLIIREILQVTGDIINFDQADWETMLGYGKHVFFGIANVDREKEKETTADSIVEELFAARFQDSGLIEQGKVIGLWGHGPWKKEKTDQIAEKIKSRVCARNPDMIDSIELNMGIVHNVDDDKLWMALIIVADSNVSENIQQKKPEANASLKVVPRIEKANSKVESVVVPEVAKTVPENTLSILRFTSDGVTRDVRVTTDLSRRYKAATQNTATPEKLLEEIFLEIQAATKFKPDMPARFKKENIVPQSELRQKSRFSLGRLWSRRNASTS